MRFITVFISVLFLFNASKSQAQINGVISGYYNQQAALVQVAEALTGGYDTLEVTRISNKGSFSFSTPLTSGFYYIKIEFRYIPYFHDPACNGRIALEAPQNPDNKTEIIDVQYLCGEAQQQYLYDYMEIWETKRADFIDENPSYRADTAYHEKLITFEKDVLKTFGNAGELHPHLKTTVHYQIAGLKELARFKTDELYEQYLKNQPVRVANGDYLNFFVQFYEKKALHFIRKNKDRYIDSLITTDRFAPLADFFMGHPYIESKEKAELLVMAMMYTQSLPNLKEERRELLFTKALTEAESPEIRRIAKDYLTSKLFLARGSNAPAFSAIDSKGNTHNQETLKGSYTYIQFWASWNDASVSDLLTINELSQEYTDIKFVSINTDRNPNDFHEFMENNTMNHLVLHTNEFGVLARYGVKSQPMYFLTDKHGKLLLSPTKEPVRMIKIFEALKSMSKSKQKPYEIIREYDD